MSLHTHLKGRLRNTSLPKNLGLMPVFEAVVNSIHSIEEKGNLGKGGKIVLTIEREPQGSFANDGRTVSPIVGFTIKDNGCGFDDVNLDSFETLDSEHKIAKGCRGVGRLMWLKAFDMIDITSHFSDEAGIMKTRNFSFDQNNGVHQIKLTSSNQNSSDTTVQLQYFKETYSKAVPKGLNVIANQLLEHCLWYFVRNDGAPDIIVQDTEESLSLYDLYGTHMHAGAVHETISIFEQQFELTHIKFRVSVNKKHHPQNSIGTHTSAFK